MAVGLPESSVAYLGYLERWYDSLPSITLEQLLSETGVSADEVAIFAVDVINGFCHKGPLYSPRVETICQPVARLFRKAWELGIDKFVLPQDNHTPDADEFQSFPPHCIAGSEESMTVPELLELPFSGKFVVVPKNSISSGISTALEEWLVSHPNLKVLVAVGDVTDMCLYQLALYLKLRSNARNLRQQVVVPADCVETYDLPVEEATKLGVEPHPGDLIHRLFLHHMHILGVRVVRTLVPA
jgi:nicotinamidase-related amidase